jgi:hypothetical protein
MLETCIGVLFKIRQPDTAVGIALDAHWSQTRRRGGSEDLMPIAINDWTPALAERRETYHILQEGPASPKHARPP